MITDRRCKLLPCQRERIYQMHHNEGHALRSLDRLFKMSNGTAFRICYPERRKAVMARINWMEYRHHEKHAMANREHREWKKRFLQPVDNSLPLR